MDNLMQHGSSAWATLAAQLCVALGIVIGTTVGALTGAVALGVSFGISFGVLAGSLITLWYRRAHARDASSRPARDTDPD